MCTADDRMLDDLDELLSEIYPYPEHRTGDNLTRLFGRNWRDVLGVIQQASNLTREQARRIADCPLDPNWELALEQAHATLPGTGLTDWSLACEVIDRVIEAAWGLTGPNWAAHEASMGAINATMAGADAPEVTRRDLMHSWRTVFPAK